MRLRKLIVSSILAVVMLLTSAGFSEAAGATVTWGKIQFKMGQIGKVTILSNVNAYMIVNNKAVRTNVVLKRGWEYGVYSYRVVGNNIYYGLGGGLYVKVTRNIKYVTPSKEKLAELYNRYGYLSNGVPVKGVVTSSNSSKTYHFSTSTDGDAYIALDQTTGGFYMYLYDSRGNQIGWNYINSGQQSMTLSAYLKKGTYSIVIKPYNWNGISSASYRLKATYAASFYRNTATFEPNETGATAYPIISGKSYSSSSETNIDKDVYKFTTVKDGAAYITLDQTTGGFYMSLFDEYGNDLGSNWINSGNNSMVIDKNLKQGTYYIIIRPNNWNGISSASYRLKATFAATYLRNTVTFETNDTRDTAYPILPGYFYNSSCETSVDRDFYQFTTAKDGKVKINVDQTTGGFYMALYDNLGNDLGSNWINSGNSTMYIEKNLTKGTYYILIKPNNWNGISSANYRVEADF